MVAVGAPGTLRAEERALVVSAGVVFALASGGAAMSAAAADAMFLAEIGPAHLGAAVALSSALLAVVLAVVGGLSDRLERRAVLGTLSALSAATLAALAALSLVMPGVAAVATLVAGKQLAAATDLSFWVVIAERLDARRSRKLLPVLAATGGAGAAAGAGLVIPIAAVAGARGVLVAAALLLVAASAGAARIAATRRVAAPGTGLGGLFGRALDPRAWGGLGSRAASGIAASWSEGMRAVRRHPLARPLALVVGVAGAFSALVYFALGVAVAGQGGGAARFASLLGGVRMAGQLLTLGVQLVLAPRVLARWGPGRALVLAPLVAVATGAGLVFAPILAVAVSAQLATRVMDSGIETPAEKLAQTLLPAGVRGRIAGFLDGTAKRVGAIVGGLAAAALGAWPLAVYAVTLGVAALWALAAARLSKALPALAIAQVQRADAPDAAELGAAADARTLERLARELDGPDRARAAELFVRLHETARADAVGPLGRAATRALRDDAGDRAIWRALIAVLDEPAPSHGPELLAALQGRGVDPTLAIRAVGLAGGVAREALAGFRASPDPAVALVAQIAAARLATTRAPRRSTLGDAGLDSADIADDGSALDVLGDAVREGGDVARVATDELAVEAACALAAVDADRALATARLLARALRRGRGDLPGRVAGFSTLARVVAWARDRRSAELSLLRADLLELARERIDAAASIVAPPNALTSLMRPATATASAARDLDALETAAALRLLGALVEGADAIEPDDLRRLASALGEPDDAVRAAAEAALATLGSAAAGELVTTAAWGRRRARDRAAALLADLPVTPAALDRLADAELDALDRTNVAIAALAPTVAEDGVLVRRLDERMREIAHTVLLLVAARRRSPAIARAAAAWTHARDAHERARTLAVLETALPRPLVQRLVEAVDDHGPADRAAALVAARVALPARDEVLRSELAGRDRLARALAVHSLGAAGRGANRSAITQAARTEALAASAASLVRRISTAIDDDTTTDGGDMPSRVESLITLGRVPLLAALTTRQLADVAERARAQPFREGEVVVSAGDVLDALIVVDEGELALRDQVFAAGTAVDELACVAPRAVEGELRGKTAGRLIRLERADFEELVDDVPGLAAAICRALGERARGGVA